MTHLWNAAHPYYATEGNYFSNDCTVEFASWEEFKTDGSWDSDVDMNLVYRWDWTKANPEEGVDADTLNIFFVGQRKALHRSEHITITDADEPEVRAWLIERARTIAAIWAPIKVVTS